MAKMLKWTVEISVSEIWVEDGFDLDDDRAVDMVLNDLRYATANEVKANVIKAPSKAHIRKLQGYID